MALFSWWNRQRATVPQMGSAITRMFGVGTTEVYAEINATTAINDGFNSNAAAFAIVTTAAKKFGSITRYVYDKAKAEEKAAAHTLENDLTTLINRPNEYEGQDAFFAKVYAYKMVCGEAFIWLNRGITSDGVEGKDRLKKPVLEMYALPSNKMIVVPDDTLFGVAGYLLEANQRVYIPKEDIIHWKSLNLDFDSSSKPQLRGRSPLASGYKTLEQNNSATDSAVRMYQNDGAKGVLTEKSLKAMTPEQQTKIQSVIDRKINNVDIKGAVATLQGDWTYHNLGTSSVDMELLEGKEMSMRELCFLFGFPYEFFDSKTPFADKSESQKKWLTNQILPDCKQLDGELNRNLLIGFNLVGRGFIATDSSELPELQKDMGALATALAAAWWLTPNEKRIQMMQEARPEPEYDEIWPAAGLSPRSEMNDGSDDLLNDTRRGISGASDDEVP